MQHNAIAEAITAEKNNLHLGTQLHHLPGLLATCSAYNLTKADSAWTLQYATCSFMMFYVRTVRCM